MLAARGGHMEIVRFLVTIGADVFCEALQTQSHRIEDGDASQCRLDTPSRTPALTALELARDHDEVVCYLESVIAGDLWTRV